MKKVFFILLIALSNLLFADTITFRVVHAATLQPIEGVSIHSYLDTSMHFKSDKYGHISLLLKDNDTLTFSKDFFHPIYIFVRARNFDSTHVISINMVPSETILHPIKGNFRSLNDFNYHFLHDKVEQDSHVQISSYEHVDASQVRKTIDGPKNRRSDIYIVPNLHLYKGKPQYKLK